MKRVFLILALAFGLGYADINTMGETKVQDSDGTRVTTLISAGYVRYFIHLDDLSRAGRVIICEAPFADIEAEKLTAWEALKKADVTYESGFKNYTIGNTFLSCASIGD